MSAFLDLDKFRKSGLLTKGATANVDMSSYQDPTYLSFTLLFDTSHNSPLFNGEAEGFLKKHLAGNASATGTSLNVAKYQPSITVTNDTIEKTYKDPTFSIEKTLISDAPVTYSSSNDLVASCAD